MSKIYFAVKAVRFYRSMISKRKKLRDLGVKLPKIEKEPEQKLIKMYLKYSGYKTITKALNNYHNFKNLKQ